MKNEVKTIKEILQDKLGRKPVKSKHTTPWQVRGSEICRNIGGKAYPVFIRFYKLDPVSAEKAYYKVKETNAKNKETLYFWWFWKTHKEKETKSNLGEKVRCPVENSGKGGAGV